MAIFHPKKILFIKNSLFIIYTQELQYLQQPAPFLKQNLLFIKKILIQVSVLCLMVTVCLVANRKVMTFLWRLYSGYTYLCVCSAVEVTLFSYIRSVF